MTSSPTNPASRLRQQRNDSGISYQISANDGSWSVIEKEPNIVRKLTRRFSTRKVLRRATMPFPKRTNTEQTVASSTFSKISASPESANNGISAWNRAMSYLANVSGLASATMDSATVGPPFVYESIGLAMPGLQVPPFTPDIEVKSKHRKGPFSSGFKWKEMRAVIDTGCAAGNWVSLETLQDLGYDKLLKLTDIERNGVVTVQGFNLQACAAVDLTWRGVPGGGRGQIGNCSRNFEMRFLVLAMNPAPFEILIGSHSIWKHQILQAPMLMALPRRVVVVSDRLVATTDLPYADRKAANEKAKKARKAENLEKAKAQPKDQVNDPLAAKKDNDPKATVSRTNTTLSTTATLHDEAVDRVNDLINEAKKHPNDTPKAPSLKCRASNNAG